MKKPKMPAFDALDVAESNASSYPEPLRHVSEKRHNRRLGDHAGLAGFGVVRTRIEPGGQSSHRHAHARQDEFVYVLEGEVELHSNDAVQQLGAGTCAGFPAGGGDAHCFVNRSDRDAVLLVVGDRTSGDEVTYPDVDLHGEYGSDGRFHFRHKDGTPY